MSAKPDPEIELRSDGWERFRRAVHAAAASGPKHRVAKKTRASRKPGRGGKRDAKV